jgi:hypothetical protein
LEDVFGSFWRPPKGTRLPGRDPATRQSTEVELKQKPPHAIKASKASKAIGAAETIRGHQEPLGALPTADRPDFRKVFASPVMKLSTARMQTKRGSESLV